MGGGLPAGAGQSRDDDDLAPALGGITGAAVLIGDDGGVVTGVRVLAHELLLLLRVGVGFEGVRARSTTDDLTGGHVDGDILRTLGS